jgi:CRISPR-associated endonuclease/helicase Cas3
VFSFWGKLGQGVYPADAHPVLCHLIDVGQVAHKLWSENIDAIIKERLGRQFQLSPDDLGAWIAFWIAAHDVGKIAPGFQAGDPSQCAVPFLAAAGFDFGGSNEPHATISAHVLMDLLPRAPHWPAVDRGLARRIAHVVGAHHGLFPEPTEVDGIGEMTLGGEPWQAARETVLNLLADIFCVAGRAPPRCVESDDQSAYAFIAGLTAVADWIGSNRTFFPVAGCHVTPETDLDRSRGYARLSAQRAADALRHLGWNRGAQVSPPAEFKSLFGFDTPSGPQRAAIAASKALAGPALVLIEAPMGEGKTEAALYLLDHWFREHGAGGAYFALPTMATSNQMFGRIEGFLRKNYAGTGRVNLHLLHGHALLNERYRNLQYAATIYDPDKQTGSVVAEGWFAQNKKQSLLAPFGVGSIDQALLAVLQTKHYFVRLFGLTGKVIVFDEVHAYDTYMSTLLKRLLVWLRALGCPVVLLSATLPAAKRQELLSAWQGSDAVLPKVPYPRISIARDGDEPISYPIETLSRRTLRVEWVGPSRLSTLLAERLSAGGCAAVIRNTVKSAQDTFGELARGLSPLGIEVELFHARFPFGRRDEIEGRVLSRYGKPGGAGVTRPSRAVLVATQVVEQSLDLDFDLLLTDIAPVDLVLQRAGRLWRHNRTRPPQFTEAGLWLIKPDETGSIPDFGTSEYVYARHILLRSYLAMRGLTRVRIPEDLEQLIEAVYDPPLPETGDATLATALAESLQDLVQKRKQHAKTARDFEIGRPDDEDLLFKNGRSLEEDDPQYAPTLQACTRLAEPTVDLIQLFEDAGALYLDAGCTRPAPAGHLTFDDMRALMQNAVSLQHRGCVAHYRNRPSPANWGENGVLRFRRLVRTDREGRSLAGEFPMRFDRELGVLFQSADSTEL